MDPALTPTPLNMACGVHVMGWRMCAMVFQYTSGCWTLVSIIPARPPTTKSLAMDSLSLVGLRGKHA